LVSNKEEYSMIVRLHRLGFAVEDVDQTRRVFRDLFGLKGKAEKADPVAGVQKAASIPFPNRCSLYLMETSDPECPVGRYLQQRGPGLERLVFVTDEILVDAKRIQEAGRDLGDEMIVETDEGLRLFVPSQHALGMAVELFQPAEPVSLYSHHRPTPIGVLGLQHIGVAVRDLEEANSTFESLFNLKMRDFRTDQHMGLQKDATIAPGNDRLWLHFVESWGPDTRVRKFLEQRGEGLEHICIEVADIRQAVRRVIGYGVPIHEHKIYTNRDDGFEAFVYPEHTTGITVELIEPHPTSKGYRVTRWDSVGSMPFIG
jgi:methylmalonyl-CoA/ethylmalonyl-CoA epimerase